VIALEVIDNFPHDKLVTINNQLNETFIVQSANYRYFEEYQLLSDPLISRYLVYMQDFQNGTTSRQWPQALQILNRIRKVSSYGRQDPENPKFIPTMSVLFFEQLEKYFPQHKLILADFDYLPDTMPGENGPVVQGKSRSNEHISYHSYCNVEKGNCDIFFPTNFEALKHLYCHITNRRTDSVKLLKHANFLQSYADLYKTTTLSGFNPLLEDFTNMSFILS